MILGLDAWVFWLILMGVFIIVEFATVNLVSIWFAGGSLAGLIASLFGAPVYVQAIVAVAVSAILLALVLIFKPFDQLKKHKQVATNSDRVIGQTGVVLTELNSIEGGGTVKVMGQVWSAVSEDGEDVPAGAMVKILGITGVKLRVKKTDSE